MCCGLIWVMAGAAAGVGAFFGTAAISAQLLTPEGVAAATAELMKQSIPIDPTTDPLQPKVLPDAMSSIGKLSGKVLLAEHLVFVLMLFWWFTVWLLGVARRLAAQKPKQPLEALKQVCGMVTLAVLLRCPPPLLRAGVSWREGGRTQASGRPCGSMRQHDTTYIWSCLNPQRDP
jgi:hypothetical protein